MMKKVMREIKSPSCEVPFHAESANPFLLSKNSETIYIENESTQRHEGQAVHEEMPTPRPKTQIQSHFDVKFKFKKMPTNVLKKMRALRVIMSDFFAPNSSTLGPRMLIKIAMTKRITISMVPKKDTSQLNGGSDKLLFMADHIVLIAWTTAQEKRVIKQVRHFALIND